MNTVTRPIIVAAIDSNGSADLHFFKLKGKPEFFEDEDGKYIEVAEQVSENEGYEPRLVYDGETDSAGKAMMDLFEWDTASVFEMADDGNLIM